MCLHKGFWKWRKKGRRSFSDAEILSGKNAKEKEGSGMGLYIEEYLIKGMGGKLICRSEENGWLEVKIWLAFAV